jgi:hypothetical protein
VHWDGDKIVDPATGVHDNFSVFVYGVAEALQRKGRLKGFVSTKLRKPTDVQAESEASLGAFFKEEATRHLDDYGLKQLSEHFPKVPCYLAFFAENEEKARLQLATRCGYMGAYFMSMFKHSKTLLVFGGGDTLEQERLQGYRVDKTKAFDITRNNGVRSNFVLALIKQEGSKPEGQQLGTGRTKDTAVI